MRAALVWILKEPLRAIAVADPSRQDKRPMNICPREQVPGRRGMGGGVKVAGNNGDRDKCAQLGFSTVIVTFNAERGVCAFSTVWF